MLHLARIACLASLLAAATALPAAAADTKAPKPRTLIDFTREEVEIDGGQPRPIRKYDYAFEAWEKKPVFLEGKGILIPAVPGNGGIGKDDRLGIAKASACELQIVIGNRNAAESFTVSMVDADGTEVSWYLNLKDRPRGMPLTYTLDLAAPDKEDKPGKKPGFDRARVKTWQIKGNWQPAAIEIVLVRLSAVQA